ncbi:MAG: SPFH domain-containing protein, partial [Deltaproteobacteria bacterium]|nr:SPFH domain-containing protein [Deltaproteobacteria bacterium]
MDQIGTKLDPAESAGGLRGCLLPLTWLLVTLVVVLVCVAFIFGVVVRPGEMGVRETTLRLPFGPKQGYSASGLKPGFHWRIPIYSRIHFVPQVLQILDLDRESVGTKGAIGALEVQTTDGSSVDVDVSVLYRYCSERGPDHGGPAELLNVVGFEKDWLLHIQTVVTNELRKVLGRLSASEFYNPVRREKEVTEAQEEMNKRLKPAGIMVEGILLRRYTYAATIDEAIFAKNLKDQEPQLRSAE